MPSSILHVVSRDGGAPVAVPVVDLPVPPDWTTIAGAKGYEIAARVIDRLHLALRCRQCGAVSVARVFTLRRAQPLCPACLQAERARVATGAGAKFLRRDPDDTRYAFYALPCGHEVRRQFGLITRAAAGETGIRCQTCHAGVLADEAAGVAGPCRGPIPKVTPGIASMPMRHLVAVTFSGSRGPTCFRGASIAKPVETAGPRPKARST